MIFYREPTAYITYIYTYILLCTYVHEPIIALLRNCDFLHQKDLPFPVMKTIFLLLPQGNSQGYQGTQ